MNKVKGINFYEDELLYSSGNGHVYLKTGYDAADQRGFYSIEKEGIWLCVMNKAGQTVNDWKLIASWIGS